MSFFGWINVKKINSRAGLGTLALAGEMNNIQLSMHLSGRKPTVPQYRHFGGGSSGKFEYEGSLNICMDSTFGRLTENDTRQNVVQLNVQKSHLFVSLRSQTLKNRLGSFAHIGHINIDVPLRPMIVHGVVYRESKMIEQKILPEIKNFGIFEEGTAAPGGATAGGGATGTAATATTAGGSSATGSSPTGAANVGSSSGQQQSSSATGQQPSSQTSNQVPASVASTLVGNAGVAQSGLAASGRDKVDKAAAASGLKQTPAAAAGRKPMSATRVEVVDENDTVYGG